MCGVFSGADVSSLYKFTESTGLRLLFDLNVLLRNGTSWDPTNPRQLLEFMRDQKMTDNLDLQLGNGKSSNIELIREW